MVLGALARLLREDRSFNGAWLLVDDARMDELHAAVKATPVIAGATARHQSLSAVQDILDQSLGTSVTIFMMICCAELPICGGSPVSISYKHAPNE